MGNSLDRGRLVSHEEVTALIFALQTLKKLILNILFLCIVYKETAPRKRCCDHLGVRLFGTHPSQVVLQIRRCLSPSLALHGHFNNFE